MGIPDWYCNLAKKVTGPWDELASDTYLKSHDVKLSNCILNIHVRPHRLEPHTTVIREAASSERISVNAETVKMTS